ncbi:hypothetical protein TRFO_17584 [Tritrichomonas foetus]|uniref:Uncharacterized protein n=1 Tax=Tritrichomonas foetus TaxID=1144522 RepID=A0A1J4KMK5_9EUKA|nr:hypothetical protein TRFO_17584 [Tritrichomonas foetus]|eukprot:OHT12537.1 hypothetical protein TRFO_17584 [Tritrichomonas foetus]
MTIFVSHFSPRVFSKRHTIVKMETIIESLQSIAKSPRILQPEQTIQLCLIPLRPFLDKNLPVEKIQEIEKALLSLLKINHGNLNVTCSISIGMNLCWVYKRDQHKHFWNLISCVMDSSTPANIVAFKYVVAKLGSHNKSSLGKITQHLLTLKDQSLHYPALLALRSLFKVCGKSLSKSAAAAFSFAKNYITNSNEATQIAAIRLLDIILQFPEVAPKKILRCSNKILSSSSNQFVIYTAASLVAKCALMPIPQNTAGPTSLVGNSQPMNEFQLNAKETKESNLKKSFEIMLQFKNHFSLIFSYFLDYLNPEFVYKNINELFNLVNKNSVSNIKKVTAFFGRDIHSILYNAIMKMKNTKISLLNLITYDEDSARETAGLAHQKIWSKKEQDRFASSALFINLAHSYQTVALEELHVALHYIAMPPDDSDTLDREYEGMATAASIIIYSLNCSIEKEKPLIIRFIKYVMEERNDNDFYLRSLFMVIAPLKKEFFSDFEIEPLLEKQIDRIIKLSANENPVYPIKLIEALLIFISIHPNYNIAKKFGRFCFSIISQLSSVSILSLARLFNNVEAPSNFILQLSLFFLNQLNTIGVPLDYIKSKITVLMKIPEEIVSKHTKKKSNERASVLYYVDNSTLSSKLLGSLPKFYARLNTEHAESFLNAAILSTNKVAGFMSILLILMNVESTNSVPRKLHQMILAALPENNDIALQIAAECIALCLTKYPDDIPDLYDYMKKENSASCFIESAVARFLNLEDQQVVDIIFRTSKRIKNPSLTNYVLHELASIYETKSVQMVSLLMGDQQLQQLLSLLCETKIFSVYQMYLISQCIEKLIPILLPNLGEKSTVIMVILALDYFKNAQNQFCKQFFFDLFRSIFALSQNVARNFKVKIPKISMRLESKLSACGALADVAYIRPFTSNLLDKLPPFLVLLQRTRDDRIELFLTASARCFASSEHTNEEISNWFRLPKQILSSNSMIGFGSSTIEPNTKVKHAALCILKELLPALASTKPLITECMDDTITSTIRAIETRRIELHEIAYEILTEFLMLFKDFITDQNVKLLELYDAQFSNAARYAFPNSMNVASLFLINFLDFTFEEYKKNEKSCLLLIETFINSLMKVKERTSGFFAIASKVCVISEEYPKVAECSASFLRTLTPLFLNLINDNIKLRTTKSDYEEITRFKDIISPFFADFLNSFIWLKKTFPTNECKLLDTPTFSSFLLMELTAATENWRSCSAFSAISSVLRYFGNELNSHLFDYIVNTMCNVACWNKKLFRPYVPKFLKYASLLTPERSDPQIWISLFSAALTHRCDASTLGLILKNCDQTIVKNSVAKVVDLVVIELSEKMISDEEAIAIVTILYDWFNEAIPTLLSHVLSMRIQDSVKFQMTMIERAFKRIETRSAIDRIASFCCEYFNQGGLETVAQISIQRPNIGLEILKRGVISQSVESFDGLNPISALHFFELVLDHFGNMKQVATEIAKAALVFLSLNGNDRAIGEKVSSTAIQIVKTCMKTEPDAMKIAFESLSEERKGELMKAMKKWSAKKVVKKVSLVKFSARVPRRRAEEDGGWQSLDGDLD